MSYWIKYFSDGKHETGNDRDIAKGLASWSRGRLDSMLSATLNYAHTTVHLSGPGPYIQRDTFIASITGHTNKRLNRQIGRQIYPNDVGWALLLTREPGVFTIEIAKEKPSLNAIQITLADVGKFLVVTITNFGGIDIKCINT